MDELRGMDCNKMTSTDNKKKNALAFVEQQLAVAGIEYDFGKIQITIQDGIPTMAIVVRSNIISGDPTGT